MIKHIAKLWFFEHVLQIALLQPSVSQNHKNIFNSVIFLNLFVVESLKDKNVSHI